LDRQVNAYETLFEIARKAILAGVDIIQLRDKNGSAKEILNFSRHILKLTKNRIPYIINDRVDVAKAGLASGVHLGQEDMPIAVARKMLGSKALIGISCQTYMHALKAQRDEADYIGFGSVFKTLTKPERHPMDIKLLRRVIDNIRIPVFAIGGIHLGNIAQLKAVGVRRIAVCRAVCQAKDIEKAVEQFLEATK
jgi:thiamine-phosphate pyrophosphorylase